MTRVLLVTNDFPPRRGGIQSYLEQFVNRLSGAGDHRLTVYAPRWKGAEDYDRRAPFEVVRHPGTLMVPEPGVDRRMRSLIRRHDIETVWFGAAAPLALLALLNNIIPFTLIFTGQTALGAGVASVVNATTPFWTAIAASLLTTDEKLTVNKLAGIGLGILGAALVIGPSALAGTGGPAWAKVAILGGTLSYAFAAIYARRFRTLGAPVIATGQLIASTVMMAPVMLLFGHPETLAIVTLPVWAAVAALAIFSTAFAYILYFRLIGSAGATNASLVTLVIPAFALVLGAIFLGETLDTYEFAGLALIAFGLITIDGRLLARRYRT